MTVAVVVTPVVAAVPVMPMIPVALVGATMIMDAFVVPVAVGVVDVQFSRVCVSSHGNGVRGGVKNGKQQTIVPHSPQGTDRFFMRNPSKPAPSRRDEETRFPPQRPVRQPFNGQG